MEGDKLRGRPTSVSRLTGYKVIQSEVKSFKNGAYVPLSQDYVGCKVLVILMNEKWMIE